MKKAKTPESIIFGKEPSIDFDSITKENYNHILMQGLDWYGNYAGVDNEITRRTYHKSWLKDWAKKNKIKQPIIPNQGIGSIAAMARLNMKGFPLSDKHKTILKDRLLEWKEKYKPAKPDPNEAKKKALLAKMKREQSIGEIYQYFEGIVDHWVNTEKKRKVEFTKKISGIEANELRNHYSWQRLDLITAMKENSEGYAWEPAKMKKLVSVFDDILEAIDQAEMISKVTKQRKKKVKPASALIKKLQYMPVFAELSLVSENPEEVVGCSTLYVYDTMKRKLKVYKSTSSEGIAVSGTTLKNCLGEHKTLRKPEELTKMNRTKAVTKWTKFYDELKTKGQECPGRLNKDCIILKVFK